MPGLSPIVLASTVDRFRGCSMRHKSPKGNFDKNPFIYKSQKSGKNLPVNRPIGRFPSGRQLRGLHFLESNCGLLTSSFSVFSSVDLVKCSSW